MENPKPFVVRAIRASCDFLFPSSCVFCGLDCDDDHICELCQEILPRNATACERCAVPLGCAPEPGIHCADCQQRPPPVAFARAPFLYEFPVDSAIKALKFGRRTHYVPAFAGVLQRELELLGDRVDALVPVPLHRWRHARRGFNQAVELCKPLRRACGLPLLRNVLRVRATTPQTGLTSAERRHNLQGAFAINGKLGCRRPLIVDDVMTTGETCRQLAKVLLNNGAESVGVLVVARSTLKS